MPRYFRADESGGFSIKTHASEYLGNFKVDIAGLREVDRIKYFECLTQIAENYPKLDRDEIEKKLFAGKVFELPDSNHLGFNKTF